ncbi:TPA: DUF58 domain-containing protein [Candidatus Poribacteria bacterium]|jgi:uncharacterized protein (DUF58 family)|nr:DUF58 domain-containing protein [Candidatus Poribacteria bacterium]HIA66923.1 DUF58 domain-containing protein [Candidatus Poribacteria bacterium]HIB86388.1 DUF58 domain-containing protein [Candidatus Poribacteria bacterium]HIC01935.1 DUF58 domain-containing protein [Candidatus Poribacteria bacterium]HIN29536.1 DUF58 domain-containing protein [Candidatus Poribacteria bacterium]
MNTKDIIKKIRRIEISTNRLVNNIFAGEYESAFKGKGMEFDEVREYQHGDEVRTIDWNVTAKMGHPFVKKFVEERELIIMLLVDVSGSTEFGTHQQKKSEIIAEISALLAFAAIKNNDKVGLICFTDQVELFIPPRKGKKHVLRLIRDILYFESKRTATDLKTVLSFLERIQKRKSVVFLISDFRDDDYEKPLQRINPRHDLIAIVVADRRETEFPDVGLIELEDTETGDIILFDSSSAKTRQYYQEKNLDEITKRQKFFLKNKIDNIAIHADQSYTQSLIHFFQYRHKKGR